MPLTHLDHKLTALLAHKDFPGVAGLVNLTNSDYDTIREHLFSASHGDVGRLIWKTSLFPAAAVVALSRAAMKAYGDNFWENFGEEIKVSVPVGKREELTAAFCNAAAQSIPCYGRANWDARKYAGEFLAQAGLPLHHCATFARVLRLAVDESGLPEPGDPEGIAETIERMLARSELHGQTVIKNALRGPAGSLLVEAAVAAISAGDYDRFNSELAKALHESFDSHPRQAAGQTLRRPFLQLDCDRSGLELNCLYPPATLCGGQGVVWSINGERHRAPGGQSFLVPVSKPALYTVELHGLNGGRSVKWMIDARTVSWPQGFAAFNAETGRNVRLETSPDGTLLPPGDYYLLHESRWTCDDVTDQVEWSEGGLTLTEVSIKPGTAFVFHDDEAEVRITSAKAVWLEAVGHSFATSSEEKKVHYGWESWPRLWIDAGANAADWSVQIAGGALCTQVTATPLDMEVGGLRACQLAAADFLGTLPPGLHRINMIVLHRDRIRHRQEWLLWVGLMTANSTEFTWSARPVNLLAESLRGFTETPGQLIAQSTQERARQITFQMGAETLALKWLREGITLESYELTAGVRNSPRSSGLGEAFPADEFSRTQLRLSITPAKHATLFVNEAPFKKASSANGVIQFDLSLASVAALHPEGGKIAVSVDGATERMVARFAKPVVAILAALKSDHDYKTLRCLVRQPVAAFRVKVCEIVSGFEVVTEGVAVNETGEACFRANDLPRIKCANTGPQTLHGQTGFGVVIGVGETKWPAGAWWIEIEIRSRAESAWEKLRDAKGGRLPLLVVQNPTAWAEDYRTHALWWGLALRGGGGAIPAQLPPADGNESKLLELLCETGALLKDRISEHVWKKQFSGLVLLRTELSKQVNWLIDAGNADAAAGVVEELNSEISTATPRSVIFSTPGLVALPAGRLAGMVEGDILRTSLLWCGRLAEAETIAGGFHGLELDPVPALGTPCPCQAPVLKFFRNGNRLRSNGTLPKDEEFTRFDFRRYFDSLGRARVNPDAIPAGVTPLSPEHFGYALQQFRHRRSTAEACSSLSNVNTIFSKSNLIAKELVSRVPKFRPLMPEAIWMRPWPEISVEDDHLAEMAVQFASVYALMARLAGERRLSFREFSNWLRYQPWLGQDQKQAVNHATTTLICQAPELLGFFVMFWQLMIQTYPHD